MLLSESLLLSHTALARPVSDLEYIHKCMNTWRQYRNIHIYRYTGRYTDTLYFTNCTVTWAINSTLYTKMFRETCLDHNSINNKSWNEMEQLGLVPQKLKMVDFWVVSLKGCVTHHVLLRFSGVLLHMYTNYMYIKLLLWLQRELLEKFLKFSPEEDCTI